MSREMQDILVVDYNGPQGNVELTVVESATLNRTNPLTRVKTMNRQRRAIAFQRGTREVTITLTIVPERLNPEVDWVKAQDQDEEFILTVEKGLDGIREQLQDCKVSDVNDTFNENGEARQEVTVEALLNIQEPQ